MDIEKKIKELTLEEKLTLLTGFDGMSAVKLAEKGINGIQMADGPYGVKTQNGDSLCYPNTCLMASSWDKDICFEIGKMLGWECEEHGIEMLLAPAVNIKRNPLAGRNFEYYSEDPYLTGVLASEYIKGIHDSGTQVCVKHFACNNQETMRWSQNSIIDDDTLRNIYLKAFEIIVKNGGVDAIMSSYNRVNGIFSTSNAYLQKTILRGEWNYDGIIMSDWCAIGELVSAYKNGLDLEMPGNAAITVPALKAAVERGELEETYVDRILVRLLTAFLRAAAKPENKHYAVDTDRLRRITGESFVLLKNDGVLPCKTSDKIALIGLGADKPRIQGGGCAKMNTNTVLSPFGEMRRFAADLEYLPDYRLTVQQMKELADYDKVIIFLTLPEDCDSEAFDRKDMYFPKEQLDCISAVSEYNKNIIAVLQNGSAVDVSFRASVKGILETYYAGSYGGGALADVIFGKTSPCGKLAESFPCSYFDVPSADNFGSMTDIIYAEREFVGYRYYSAFGVETAYPFGFGLSYCDFETSDIKIKKVSDDYEFSVSFEVKNKSDADGKEVVQIYLKSYDKFSPKMQLIDFMTVRLSAHGRQRCELHLTKEKFERYTSGKRVVPQGKFGICVALSSEHILKEETFELRTSEAQIFDRHTLVGKLLTDERYRDIALKYMLTAINAWAYGNKYNGENFENDVFLKSSVYNMPIRSFTYFSGEEFDEAVLEKLLKELSSVG